MTAASAVLTLVLAACGGDDDGPEPSGPLRWECPAGWVAYEAGGCGPAALLCAEGGGAAAGACDGITPGPIGAWREPGAPDGPPARDWAPDLSGACPAGWVARERGLCDPAPDPGCEPGAEALPDGSCTATGASDCPASEWPDLGAEPAGARVVHVRAGAPDPLADGSELLPFATIAEGVTAAGPGGWVRVAAGDYDTAIDVTATVHVVAVCAARVRWSGATGVTVARASGTGVTLDVRGVTLAPDAANAVVAEVGATVRVERARIDGAVGRGLYALAARLEARDVVVTGTTPDAEGRSRAFQSNSAGALDLARCAAIENINKGVFVLDPGTTVTMRDSVIRGTRLDGDEDGQGVYVQDGATAMLERVWIVDSASQAVFAGRGGARAEVRQAVLAATRSPMTAGSGYGASAQDDATVLLEDVAIEDCAGAGITAQLGGIVEARRVDVARSGSVGVIAVGTGRIALEHARVRETRAAPSGRLGRGLEVHDGGTIVAARVLVDANREIGVIALGGTLTLRDAVVRDTLPRAGGLLGRGIEVSHGGELTLERVTVHAVHDVAVNAGHSGTRATISDLAISDVRLSAEARARGLDVEDGAAVVADRVLIDGATEIGLYVGGGGATLDLRDGAVLSTRPIVLTDETPVFGRGVEIAADVSVTLTRVLVAEAMEMGIGVVRETDAPVTVTLEDVVVRDVVPSARGFGLGVGTFGGGTIRGTRVSVVDVVGAAVLTATRDDLGAARAGGELVMTDLFVRGVSSGTVRVDEALRPAGSLVAYGLHATTMSRVAVTRAVLDDAGFGFYSAGGAIELDTAVVVRQADALGAVAPGAPEPMMRNVRGATNARDEVVARDDLPEASSLETPTAICVSAEDC